MMPIAPLMIEHRLIERMVKIIEGELHKTGETGNFNAGVINTAIEFIRTYADKCHHGKEEDILFKHLEKKKIEPTHRKTMYELIKEHSWGRKKVSSVINAMERLTAGDKSAISEITSTLAELVDFYPKHIEKEDKHFFIPVMDYFTSPEKDKMLEECWEFDKKFIHEKYRALIEELEKS